VKVDLGTAPGAFPPGFDKFVDLVASPDIPQDRMVVADLNKPWPFYNGEVDHFRAYDIIEHLRDKIFTMNEMWRCLAPKGTVEIAVPTTDGPGAFMDPTHISFWHERSFMYYEAGNPYRERFANNYGIVAAFRTLTKKIDQTPDGPKLTILLAAVK
jgi:SAM-dependent methyltransferase